MWNTRKGILGTFAFNHIANLSLFLVSSYYSVKHSLEYLVELHRTSCYTQVRSSYASNPTFELHITFFHHKHHCPHQWYCQPQWQHTTQPQNQKWLPLSHEHTTPLQNHSQMWPHKHWATSPLVAWQPHYIADWWGTMTDSNYEQPTRMLHNQW